LCHANSDLLIACDIDAVEHLDYNFAVMGLEVL